MSISIPVIATPTTTIPPYIYEVVGYTEAQNHWEDFNNLLWFPVEEAIEKLKRGSHKWGIEQWKNTHKR